MKKLLHKLLGNIQKAYQSDKNIGENRNGHNRDNSTNKIPQNTSHHPACRFFQSINSINQEYIFETLEFFNFGQRS